MNMEMTSAYVGLCGERKKGVYDSAMKQNAVAANNNSTNSVDEYYKGLCKKFPQISFNTNGGVMRCSPNKVVVNLSYDCLKKMANDSEFAKKIEWNLSGEVAANSQIYLSAKCKGVELGGRKVTYDADGNRQSSCGGMRTANSSNKSSSTANAQKQQKAAKTGRVEKRGKEEYLEKAREKRKRSEEYLEKAREKRKRNKEYLEELRKIRNDRDVYISEMQENSNSAVKAYIQAGYDNADLLSALDAKI